MAQLTLGDKAMRVLKMLMGMRNSHVAAAMAAHGFTDAELHEGWTLLRGVSRERLDAVTASGDPSLIDRLDAWENRWFPIAGATLERRFPAVHAQVFNKLSQTSGVAVAISVGTFVARYDEMASGAGSYGEEGIAAKEVLANRGLTTAVIDDARAMLASVASIDPRSEVTTLEADAAELAKAEERLWGWYLEWSQIARVAVTQRPLLKEMGFRAMRAKAAAVVLDATVDAPAPPTPGASSAGAVHVRID